MDKRKAVEWFKRAADSGLPAAQAALADMHERGEGGLLFGNYKAAAPLIQEAANQGDAYAMNKLGLYYYYGWGGLGKDQAKAVSLFKASAAQGNANAMANLGYAYLNGRGGLKKDEYIARQHFEVAAARGDAMGQKNLAYFYEAGWAGLEPNIKEALRLYRLAANQGESWAEDQIKRINWNSVDNNRLSGRAAYIPPVKTPYIPRCWWDGFAMSYICN